MDFELLPGRQVRTITHEIKAGQKASLWFKLAPGEIFRLERLNFNAGNGTKISVTGIQIDKEDLLVPGSRVALSYYNVSDPVYERLDMIRDEIRIDILNEGADATLRVGAIFRSYRQLGGEV